MNRQRLCRIFFRVSFITGSHKVSAQPAQSFQSMTRDFQTKFFLPSLLFPEIAGDLPPVYFPSSE